MASQQEKCSYTITEIKSQNSSGCGEPGGFVEQQQLHEKCSNNGKAIEGFDCEGARGVVALVPLSCVPIDTGLEFEEHAEGSSVKHKTESTNVGIKIGQQPASANGENIKRKHTTVGTDGEIYFQLYKFLDDNEQYILEMHAVQSGDVHYYRVTLENKANEKWSVRIYELEEIQDSFIYLMEEDPSPPKFHKKYNLPLLERLSGWTLEKRKRNKGKEDKLDKKKCGNNIQDKFYYHQSRQFRSLVEVTSFLLYSSKLKDLEPVTSINNVPVLLEDKAITTMVMLPHVEPSNTINACLSTESSKEISPQTIVDEPQKSCFSSNTPTNESKEIQNSEKNENEDFDIEEEFLQLFDYFFDDEERRLAEKIFYLNG